MRSIERIDGKTKTAETNAMGRRIADEGGISRFARDVSHPRNWAKGRSRSSASSLDPIQSVAIDVEYRVIGQGLHNLP